MNFDFPTSPKAGIFGLSLDTPDISESLPDITSLRQSVGTSFNSGPAVPDLSSFNESADNLRDSVMDMSNFFGTGTPAPPTAAELDQDSEPDEEQMPQQPPPQAAPPPPPPPSQSAPVNPPTPPPQSLPVAPPTPEYNQQQIGQDFPQGPTMDTTPQIVVPDSAPDQVEIELQEEPQEQHELPSIPVKEKSSDNVKFKSDDVKERNKINVNQEDEDEDEFGNEQYSLLNTKSNFQVLGLNSQIVNIQLQPKESVRCEPGVLMHMDPKIVNSTSCHWSVSRCMSGEKQFVTTFSNTSNEPLVLGLSPNQASSKIVPVDLDDPLIEQKLKCLQGSWLGTMGSSAHLSFQFDCRPITCCFGGQGIRQQVIEGSGTVFLVGGGTIMRRVMERHEKIVIDDHCLLAWSGSVGFAGRTAAERCTEWCCNCTGEGLFNFVISGGDKGGVIYIQSMPFQKFRAAITGGDPTKH